MRKLPSSLDNPIDNYLIDLCEKLAPIYNYYNFTPNVLTTFSLLFGIISVLLFVNDFYVLAAIIFFISYFFDCCDGHYARKYGLVTTFGCYYDHVSDTLKYIMMGCAMYYKSPTRFYTILPIFSILLFLSLVHTGCGELYTDEDVQSDSLSYFKPFCPNREEPEKALTLTKYFGFGTLNLAVALMIISYKFL